MDYSALRQQILNDIKGNVSLQKSVVELRNKIKNKSAKFSDVAKMSDKLSEVTSKAIRSIAPDENTLGEYAEQVIEPIYHAMQTTTLTACVSVQQIINDKSGIGLKPVDVKPDQSRLVHIKARYRETPSFDDVSFLLGEDVTQNIAKAAITDSIRQNARQMQDAGLETYVTRTDNNACCDWCASKVGTYSIDNIPNDFWAVHKGCSCEFEYKSKKTSSRVFFSTDENGNITRQSK